MSTKKFSSEFSSRGTVKGTDKLLISNIDTGASEVTTVAELLASLSTFAAGQIGFPATQIPSANVNTLDDYEEGTFTPVLTFGTASSGITYSTAAGYYTKIGNWVNITSRVTLTSKGVSSGNAMISGLPFSADVVTPCSLYCTNVSFADMLIGIVSTNTILVREITNAGSVSLLTYEDFADNSSMHVSCSYKV